MAKFLAISMDINPVVVFSGVGALANSNRPRAELLIRKMWHYLFNVLPRGEGSNLRAMRFRELNIIYDNFKLLYEKSSGITKDGCEHMLNVIKTTLSAQHSDGINQVLGVGRAFGMGGKNLFFQDGFESKFTVGRMFYSTLFTTALTSNPLCLAKLTDYNNLPLEDYQIILQTQEWFNNWMQEWYSDLEHSIQLGYRPMWHSIFGTNQRTDSLANLGKADSTNPWNTKINQNNSTGIVIRGISFNGTRAIMLSQMNPSNSLGVTVGTNIYNQFKANFEKMQLICQKIHDRILLMCNQKMQDVFPYTHAGNTEPFVRNRYLTYSSLAPDSSYKDLAGILPVYPPNKQLEAKDDYTRFFKNFVSPIYGPKEAFDIMKDDVEKSEATKNLLQRLPFINKFVKLYNPTHINYEINIVDSSNNKNPNYGSLRLRSKLEQTFITQYGLIEVHNAVNGTVNCKYPHMLSVGDKFSLWGLKSTSGVFKAEKPTIIVDNQWVFSSNPGFNVGDIVQIRDMGQNLRLTRNGSLGATVYRNNPTSVTATSQAPDYSFDMRATSGPTSLDGVIPKIRALTSTKQHSWIERAVKSITVNNGVYYITLSSTTSSTGTTATFTNVDFNTINGYLVFVQNQSKIDTSFSKHTFTVTNVNDPYTVTVDAPVNFTDSGVHLEYDFNTLEIISNKELVKLLDKYIRYTSPNLFSTFQYNRCFNSDQKIYYGRYASTSQVASANTTKNFPDFYPGNGCIWFAGSADFQSYNKSDNADTAAHEIIGHGTYILNQNVSKKDTIPEAITIAPKNVMYVEGGGTIIESFIGELFPEATGEPERKLLNINSNKIYYTSKGFKGIDNAFEVGSLVTIFSIDGNDKTNITSAGFTYPFGTNFVKLLKVASEGSDSNGSYFTVTNSDGSIINLTNITFTDSYVVNIDYMYAIVGIIEIVAGEQYTGTIGMGDIAMNYFGMPATQVELLYNSVGASENRNSNLVGQQISYIWGRLELQKKVDDYVASISTLIPGFNNDKFYELGHVKGFLDAMQLTGNLDDNLVNKRIEEFKKYVLQGGDPTQYTIGQV